MKKVWIAIALTALLGAGRPAGADTRNGTLDLTGNPSDGLFGYHIYGTDLFPRGLSFDGNSTSNPIWGLGLTIGGSNDGDLILSNYVAGLHMLEMRGDGGELWLGPGVGHPGNGVQLAVTAGTSTAPRDALGTAVYGDQAGLSLNQGLVGTSARTRITFNKDFHLGTDMNQLNVADFFLEDVTQPGNNRFPLIISAGSSSTPDLLTVGYGATVNGTTTLNGPASLLGSSTTVANTLQHTGNQLGFYGAAPVTKPVVTGCTCDGSGLKSLIQALASMGLVIDQTNP